MDKYCIGWDGSYGDSPLLFRHHTATGRLRQDLGYQADSIEAAERRYEEAQAAEERAARRAAVAAVAVEQLRAEEAKLPPEPKPGSVVKFVRLYDGKRYSYAARRVRDKGWVITRANAPLSDAAYVTWKYLVERAHKNRVWLATGWDRLEKSD